MERVSIHLVQNAGNVTDPIDGHYYITPDGKVFRFLLSDGEIGGFGSILKSIGAIVLGSTPAFVPLIPGISQNVQQAIAAGAQIAAGFLQPSTSGSIDFRAYASALIQGIDNLIREIASGQLVGDRVTEILKAQEAVYIFQRLPQQSSWRSRDDAAFRQIEATVIAKLDELRMTPAPETQPGQSQALVPVTQPGGSDSGVVGLWDGAKSFVNENPTFSLIIVGFASYMFFGKKL